MRFLVCRYRDIGVDARAHRHSLLGRVSGSGERGMRLLFFGPREESIRTR